VGTILGSERIASSWASTQRYEYYLIQTPPITVAEFQVIRPITEPIDSVPRGSVKSARPSQWQETGNASRVHAKVFVGPQSRDSGWKPPNSSSPGENIQNTTAPPLRWNAGFTHQIGEPSTGTTPETRPFSVSKRAGLGKLSLRVALYPSYQHGRYYQGEMRQHQQVVGKSQSGSTRIPATVGAPASLVGKPWVRPESRLSTLILIHDCPLLGMFAL
jgi:hypothetical protein